MGTLLTLIGLFVALIAWFNPFAFDMLVRIALFILGFDMMGMLAKLGVFALNFFFPVFGDAFGMFSWTLLFLFMAELIIVVIEADRPYRLFIKPAAVFATAFLSLGFQPALVVTGTDLLINLTRELPSHK